MSYDINHYNKTDFENYRALSLDEILCLSPSSRVYVCVDDRIIKKVKKWALEDAGNLSDLNSKYVCWYKQLLLMKRRMGGFFLHQVCIEGEETSDFVITSGEEKTYYVDVVSAELKDRFELNYRNLTTPTISTNPTAPNDLTDLTENELLGTIVEDNLIYSGFPFYEELFMVPC